ncbi:MAG: YbhB/YbcL family Raf kinase inhibitor-like protein [Deltaproteobacteria bacterium]|nr:YbhB/YbcL family Raf kinase inhibitor-like protein [Deltaproteobacteria bacterium]
MRLTSSTFQMNGEIPKRHSGEGDDLSPPLEWSDIPGGTREFAIICEDPDAPVRAGKEHPFVHWTIYNLSPNVSSLPEGLPAFERMELPVRADQGINSMGNVGYNGPMPPEGHGVHHYRFTLYALDIELALPPRARKEELVQAMSGHVLAIGKLVGTYERLAGGERRTA